MRETSLQLSACAFKSLGASTVQGDGTLLLNNGRALLTFVSLYRGLAVIRLITVFRWTRERAHQPLIYLIGSPNPPNFCGKTGPFSRRYSTPLLRGRQREP